MPALSNPKHEIFARELANGTPADEAYALAGYRKSRSNASVLRTNQNISGRIAELQSAGSVRAEITIERLIREADAIQPAAMASGQYSAATSALISKAKLAGLWGEKRHDTNINRNVDPRTLSDEQLADIVARGCEDIAEASGDPKETPQPGELRRRAIGARH
jgi:hypothetical protein